MRIDSKRNSRETSIQSQKFLTYMMIRKQMMKSQKIQINNSLKYYTETISALTLLYRNTTSPINSASSFTPRVITRSNTTDSNS